MRLDNFNPIKSLTSFTNSIGELAMEVKSKVLNFCNIGTSTGGNEKTANQLFKEEKKDLMRLVDNSRKVGAVKNVRINEKLGSIQKSHPEKFKNDPELLKLAEKYPPAQATVKLDRSEAPRTAKLDFNEKKDHLLLLARVPTKSEHIISSIRRTLTELKNENSVKFNSDPVLQELEKKYNF